MNVICTLHDASMLVAPGGKLICQTCQPVCRAATVLDYNKHMASIDRFDQMVQCAGTSMLHELTINQSIKIYFLSNRNITVYTVYASAQKAAREAYAD